MMDLSLLTLILFIFLALALLLIYRKQSQLRHAVAENGQLLQRHQEELKALYSGAAGVGSHLIRLENQINDLTDRQEQQEIHDPASQNYHLAIDLVHQGADVSALVSQCGLLHEEAELLVRLHGPQSLE
ncbi:MAG: DUF2802 domain-containing protein [Pseudomonadota bacterium]|nr:DUF2802 domain-containing protein [Pseudomonadota bacterium]